MNWVQLVILILQLLKQLKSSQSAEEFSSNVQASLQIPLANGDLLKWLWEHREQIIDLVLKFIDAINNQPVTTQQTVDDLVADLRGE